MDLKQLGDIYFKASNREPSDEGIAAVVRALRDEFKCWIDADKMFMTILGAATPAGDKAAGEEAVSGVRPSPQSSVPASAPAADFIDFVAQLPDAADLCTELHGYQLYDGSCSSCGKKKAAADPSPHCEWEGGNWDWVSDCGVVQENPPLTPDCPSCGKPIKFQEQQP